MRLVGLRYAAGWKRPPLNVLPHRIWSCVNVWIQPEWRGPCWCKVLSAILTSFHWGCSHRSPFSFLSSVNSILPEGNRDRCKPSGHRETAYKVERGTRRPGCCCAYGMRCSQEDSAAFWFLIWATGTVTVEAVYIWEVRHKGSNYFWSQLLLV